MQFYWFITFFFSVCLSQTHTSVCISCGNLFMRYTFLFPVIKLVMVWAWVVTVCAFKNKSNWKQSSFFSDQSMFNMSEWIAAKWWNRLQTNTKPLYTEQYAYQAHYVSRNPAELRAFTWIALPKACNYQCCALLWHTLYINAAIIVSF